MENKKIKILFSGKKGILLQKPPKSLSDLYTIIESYYHIDSAKIQITFKDTDKDECEILDDITYFTAFNEFPTKMILNITMFNSVPISRLNSIKVLKGRKTLKFFKSKSRKMGVFDLETETLQWVIFPNGVKFKEFAAWTDLPTGEIFYCGGGHPLSSAEAYILNPYTQTFKVLPNMLQARHSHGIIYQNQYVHVYGGATDMLFLNSSLNHCESFSLKSQTWEEQPALDSPRSDIATAMTPEGLFVFGKGSPYLVSYNSDSTQIDLKSDQGGCLAFADNLFFAFHGTSLKIFDFASKNLIDELPLPNCESWWSHSPPVIYNKMIYFLWWNEPGWVCQYNRDAKVFTKLISLFI